MEILKLNLQQTEPAAPDAEEIRFQIALLAALSGTAISFLARFIFDAPLLAELLTQAIFAILPINLIAFVVGFLGLFAKHLAFLGCVILYAGALTGAAYYLLRWIASRPMQSQTTAKHLAIFSIFLLAIWLVTMLVVLPVLGSGLFGTYLRQGAFYSALSLLLVFAFYALSMLIFMRLFTQKPEVVQANQHRFSRRRLMRGISYAVLAVGVYDIGKSLLKTWFQFTSGRVTNGDGNFPNLNGLALETTPVRDFYEVSKNPFDPEVNAQRWRLEIGGLVENPYLLTYAEIQSLPAIEQHATLECIDNPVGGNLIGNALWRGVRLRDVLERAVLREGVVDIVLRAADGYTDSIALDRALRDGTVLVYQMNSEPLTPTHGFPLRLIVPGIYGMKNVKWITGIEAVDYDFKGYWQKRGWNDKAEYKTMSRIDVPDSTVKGSADIAGIAFAGDRGIAKVEVSTDGGRTWEAAEMKEPFSPFSWVLWRKVWTPSQSGDYRLKVRATDGTGTVQTAQYAPPDPDGAAGYHEVKATSE